MQQVKIALVSIRPKISDKNANIQKIEEWVKKTKADMYVFGETTLTGYLPKEDLKNISETIDGPSVKKISIIAEKNKCYIVFGFPKKDKDVKGLIHNSAVLAHPDGKVDYYDKWFLPTFGPFKEKLYFDEGEKLEVFSTKYGKIGLIICYDIYFSELCKAYSLQGADIVICISASPSSTRKYFEKILPGWALTG